MAVNNTHYYGFRWSIAGSGAPQPQPLRMSVASGQDDTDDASVSIGLYPGDPVKLVNTGGVTIANTTNAVWGIVVGIEPYWDGTVMRPGNKLPNQTTWGTVEERRSNVLVVPATWGVWEVDTDGTNDSYDTRAEFAAFVGSNVNHVCPGGTATAVANTDSADPYMDISSVATTPTLTWRIVGISQTSDNKDYAGSYVKMLVRINVSEEAGMPVDSMVVTGV